jgi:hypothetical protein
VREEGAVWSLLADMMTHPVVAPPRLRDRVLGHDFEILFLYTYKYNLLQVIYNNSLDI